MKIIFQVRTRKPAKTIIGRALYAVQDYMIRRRMAKTKEPELIPVMAYIAVTKEVLEDGSLHYEFHDVE